MSDNADGCHLNESELKQIAERYDRRAGGHHDRYSMLHDWVWPAVQERQRTIIQFLQHLLKVPVDEAKLLEVGCGRGMNLVEMIRIGFRPENLAANELLPERVADARRNLPANLRVVAGDATTAPFADNEFDIVYQATVFTSILDHSFRKRLANSMWRWVKPGGGVLWYDFQYNNPRNPDVEGISLAQTRALFPEGVFHAKRITLAPPISRFVTRVHPRAYGLLNALPFLRTHILCWIGKK